MKIRKVKVGMRLKILMFCIFSTLIALGLQTIFFQHTSSELIYSQAKEASLNSLQNMQDDIYTFIKSIESSIIDIYNQKDFIYDLTNEADFSTLKFKHSSVALNMAISSFQPSQRITAIYIYDINHNLISFYRHATTPRNTYPEDIYDDEEENNVSVVKEYADSDEMVMLISSYYNSNRKLDIIRFVLKIYDSNAARKIGYIVCDVDPYNFLKRGEKYTFSKEQIIWIQPAGDRPVKLAGELIGNNKEHYEKATSLIYSDNWPAESDIANEDSIFFAVPQKKYNLTAFSLTPQSLLEKSQNILTRNLAIIAMLIISIFSVTSVFISRSLTIPLENMVDTMIRIKEGDTSLRLQGLKDDEIGKLGEVFNEMLDRIQYLIMREYQSEILMNQAKYKALQAQVNPHFLYNTLDTMSSIAASQQCNTVSNLCKALSNIFRYSIDMKNNLSTIEKEIIHLKNYMYVMNVRMQNDIDININVDKNLLNELIPRISIQPMVENSIIHGLKDKHGDKKVSIEVKPYGEDILISVADNGIGMDAEQINHQLEVADTDVLKKGSSIGLTNINARVKLLFGKDYGIKVHSVKGEGSTVTLRIPRVKEGGDKNAYGEL
mgnify:FL=1